jgi:hypothetical protein
MAETAPASNNKSVTFRGRVENEMPVVSQAQNRWAHAHANDKNKTGKAARELVSATHGTKVRKLPQHVDGDRAKRAMKRGAISAKAAAKHLGDGY